MTRTITEIAGICGVSHQAVQDARARRNRAWTHRYALVAAGEPDPGPTRRPPTPTALLAARAGLSIVEMAARLDVSPRHLRRAVEGAAPDVLAQARVMVAELEAARSAS